MNVPRTVTPPGEPVTVIVYGPRATLATTNIPEKLPPVEPEIAQLDVPTGVPDIEQVVADALRDPLTLTIDAVGPEDGIIMIAVTVKVAWALMK